MKILVASDLHYTLRQLDWIVSVADEFDVVVVAGDHLDVASSVDLDVQIAVALEYFSRLAQRSALIVCSGNHDLDARNGHDEKFASWIAQARAVGAATDGDLVEIAGWSFTACGWWDGPGSKADVEAQLEDHARSAGRPWAWVYHWPPPDSPLSITRRGSYGDAELATWIRAHRPDLVLTGHVHESPFHPDGSFVDEIDGAVVVNPGQQRGPLPTHVEIDTDAGTVLWRSLEGVQELTVSLPVPQ